MHDFLIGAQHRKGLAKEDEEGDKELHVHPKVEEFVRICGEACQPVFVVKGGLCVRHQSPCKAIDSHWLLACLADES